MSSIKTKQFQVKTAFGMPDVPESMMAMGFEDSTNPFIPVISPSYVFRNDKLRELLAFLQQPDGDALFLTGPTGSGKTSIATETCGRLHWPVQQVTAWSRMELSDLIGHHQLVSEQPGAAPIMKFHYGALSIAMRHGHVLLINEVDLVEPAELAGLNDVLEGRPLVISANGGEIIKPHPFFRVIVTGNSVGYGDETGLYQGVVVQNLAAMDRYRITEIDYATEEVELTLLQQVAPSLPKAIREGMVRVANEVRKLFVGADGANSQLSITMSTRTLVRWVRLAQRFRGAPNPLEYSLQNALLRRARPEEQVAITRIAADVFGEAWSTK